MPESLELARRTEKALVALAVHTRELTTRLDALEVRLDDLVEDRLELDELATHDEMLEVRLHSAKVAAEVSRLGINLRAQIDDVKAKLPTDHDQRVAVLAETIIDLSDGIDTTPADLRSVEDDDGPRWADTA